MGLINPKSSRPNRVKGAAIVITEVIIVRAIIVKEAGFALKKGFDVLIENTNASSVRTLPINQFVCSMAGAPR